MEDLYVFSFYLDGLELVMGYLLQTLNRGPM